MSWSGYIPGSLLRERNERGWKTSSFCNGASSCAQVKWVKSSHCNNGSCAEVAHQGDMIHVRSSVQPDRVVVFDEAEWAAFVAGIKAGEFEDGGSHESL